VLALRLEQGAMISAQRRCLPANMSATTCHMSISLDGFVAGPDRSLEHPLGRRGIELHHWHLDEPLHDADARARDLLLRPRGAYVMGRNMFGPIRGPWHEDWRGWWGDEPPYHAPVFVLTHYEHAPIELKGGTTFHFVTDGFDAAQRAYLKVLQIGSLLLSVPRTDEHIPDTYLVRATHGDV
jgi:dihydrofolate reductase